tara:strand:- start:976 stop:2208 length:1233 start_codon:yes stop_codon:yes gene_type:complete
LAFALLFLCGGFFMIIIDENNKEFASEIQTVLRGRGVDSTIFCDSLIDSGVRSDKVFVSSASANTDLKSDKNLIPFLKKNGFKKAVILEWNANTFSVEGFLNGAISICKVPVSVNDKSSLKYFYLNYFVESIVKSIPNLPCVDDKSVKLTALVRKIATTDATVLVNGPTGTGKELVSNLVHHFSNRRENAFVAVNCAAIPDQMLESMLFGHEKGAFTGAVQPNKGLLRAADQGTVLLDEISEMPLTLQAKLLRVIQEKKVMPIGTSQEINVDVRIVATTNRNMLEEVKKGNFREDLYYRLNVFPVNTLHLAERRSDIPSIVANMLYKMDLDYDEKTKICSEALVQLENYKWPGNVRELHNVIQRAKILCSNGEIQPSDLIFDSFANDQTTNTAEALAAKFRNNVSDEVLL